MRNNRMRWMGALCVAALALASVVRAADAADAAVTAALDKALEQAIDEKRLVGAVLIVNRNGKPVYSRAVGMADRESGLRMWPGALFRLASVSKSHIAIASAVLLERGVIDLDDPVTDYLPYFTPALPDGTTPTITVRHLLTFTAGLNYSFMEPADGPYHQAGVSDGLDNLSISLEDNIRRIASAPLLFEPGSQFHYSLALDVMGGVIAAATGKPLPEAMRDLVWSPLGMDETSFVVPEDEAYRLATPYFNADPEPKRMSADQLVTLPGGSIHFSPGRATNPNAFPSGGAGIHSTAADMMRLLECMQNGGSPLISRTTMDQVGRNQIGDLRMMPGVAFGLGVGVTLDRAASGAPEPDGTIEWSGVYGNNWWVDRLHGYSVILLTNTAFEGMNGKVVEDIKQALYK